MIDQAHLHPMTVHFPIAVVTIGFLFDLLAMFNKKNPCLSRTGYWLALIGMISVVVAFGTGYFLTEEMEGEAGAMRDSHETYATIALVVIILSTLFRLMVTYLKRENRLTAWVSLGLQGISLLFVTITGYLGGSLVIDYLIGL